MKRCHDCLEEKPLSDFHRNKSKPDGRQSRCKPCQRMRVGEGRKPYGEYLKGWHEKNPDFKTDQNYRKNYGISLLQYRQMSEDQGGKCAICGVGKEDRPEGKRQLLHVDHDHKTGKVRALLCSACNRHLAVVENTDWWKLALAYLQKHT